MVHLHKTISTPFILIKRLCQYFTVNDKQSISLIPLLKRLETMLRLLLLLHLFWRTTSPMKYLKSSVIVARVVVVQPWAKWAPHRVRQRSSNGNWVTLWSNWERDDGNCFRCGKIQWLHVWKKNCRRQWPQTPWINSQEATSSCSKEISRDDDPSAKVRLGG